MRRPARAPHPRRRAPLTRSAAATCQTRQVRKELIDLVAAELDLNVDSIRLAASTRRRRAQGPPWERQRSAKQP